MVAEKPDLLLDWMPSRLSSLLLGWLRYAVLDKLLGSDAAVFRRRTGSSSSCSSCRPSSFSCSCLPHRSPDPTACLRHPFRYFHSRIPHRFALPKFFLAIRPGTNRFEDVLLVVSSHIRRCAILRVSTSVLASAKAVVICVAADFFHPVPDQCCKMASHAARSCFTSRKRPAIIDFIIPHLH